MKLTGKEWAKIWRNKIPCVVSDNINSFERFIQPTTKTQAYDGTIGGDLFWPKDMINKKRLEVIDWFPEHDEYFLGNTPIYKLKKFLKNNK